MNDFLPVVPESFDRLVIYWSDKNKIVLLDEEILAEKLKWQQIA